jgi:hypothetical protein
VSDYTVSWWPKGADKWGLDPRKPLKPQVIASAAQMAFIFGGPLFILATLKHWLPLVENHIFWISSFSCIAVGFVGSLAIIPDRTLPPKLPLVLKLMYRAGLGFCFTAWVFGIGLAANGYGMPTSVRDVPVVAKHQRYLASTRPWPGSRAVVDIGVSPSVYETLDAPVVAIHPSDAELEAMPDATRIRLVIGKGRFGMDWQPVE